MLSVGSALAQDYDLEFTLPTAGKSGCMVCHGDPNLVRPLGDGFVSYYVDPAVLDGSAHSKIMCTGCHTDFAFKAPHGADRTDWRAVAKMACKNCHQDQFEAFGKGIHSLSVKPGTAEANEVRGESMASRAATATSRPATSSAGATGSAGATSSVAATGSAPASGSVPPTGSADGTRSAGTTGSVTSTPTAEKPLCGDCHGAHDIAMLTDNPEGGLILHRRGREVCGRCHTEPWETYNDYYHGRAFKAGAWDAPACWDCHGWHDIYPTDDRRSAVSESNITETCASCHKKAGQDFAVASKDMIHGRDEVLRQNPAYALYVRVKDAIGGFFGGLFDR